MFYLTWFLLYAVILYIHFFFQVSFSLAENKEAMIYMIFSNVPIQKLNVIKSKLDARLKKFVDGEEHIDMNRMQTVVNRHRQETLSHLETNPHDAVAFMVIADMLYGTSKDDVCIVLAVFLYFYIICMCNCRSS